MHVRTNINAGDQTETAVVDRTDPFSTAIDLYKTANTIVENSLTDPNALKLLMNYLPPANQ